MVSALKLLTVSYIQVTMVTNYFQYAKQKMEIHKAFMCCIVWYLSWFFFSGYQSLSFLQMSLYWSEIDCMGFIQSLLEHILALQHNFNSDRVSDYKQNELPFCLDIKSSLPFHPLFSLISFHLQFFPILFSFLFFFIFVSLKVKLLLLK